MWLLIHNLSQFALCGLALWNFYEPLFTFYVRKWKYTRGTVHILKCFITDKGIVFHNL